MKTKSLFTLIVFSALMINLVIISAATNVTGDIFWKNTVPTVVGVITDANTGDEIRENGITVEVTCYHEGEKSTSSIWVTRNVSQWYSAVFWPNQDCFPGDYVTVEASKGNKVGFNSSNFGALSTKRIDIQMQETPIVPEFGFWIGSMTLISAVAMFFIIRKK
jgi:hypothetical protein